MEVILLEKIRHLGGLGDRVNVKGGYGRNYLIPEGKAVFATPSNIEKFESQRAELEAIAADKLQQATLKQQQLHALSVVTLAAKAGEEGKLFGSISPRDIAEAITQAGIPIEKRHVRLPEGSLRLLGQYDIVIELESDVTATIQLHIVPSS